MPTIVDSGPIVALLRRDDHRHRVAVALFGRAPRPWITREAALSEAQFLLWRTATGAGPLFELLERARLRVGYTARGDKPALAALMRRYESVPMSVADACLVRMSELAPRDPILTFDPSFAVYRRGDRRLVPRL